MKKFGLLGRKLQHSYSPKIHKYFDEYEYLLYEKEPEELSSFLKNLDLDGLNVTIPYKKEVIKHCTNLSAKAKSIGAVNTIIKEKNGELTGYNTDYYGFLYMLNTINASVKNKKAIVLGSGGASLTCQTVLDDLGAKEIVVISTKSEENNYLNIQKHFDAQIIVNATPVGMYPKVNECLIDLKKFKKCEAVLDLIYNPSQTLLLKQANELEIKNANGLSMLIAQAKQSAELFTLKEIDDSIIDEITKDFII